MTSDARNRDIQLAFELKNQSQDLDEIVRHHFPMVYSTCFRITRDRHDAEDAAQAVFLCLAVQLREKRKIKSLGPWLYQVACRASIDLCRKRKRRLTHEAAAAVDDSISIDPSAEARLDEIRPLLLSCLNDLPAKYRLPLILHYFGGLSNEELARELGCTRTTLRVRLHRGHKMLRESLRRNGVQLTTGALALALTSAVHWQVSSTIASSTPAGIAISGYSLAACSAPLDALTAAASAAGSRVVNVKLFMLVAAAAATFAAASAPLLARMRDWQEVPLIPLIEDLAEPIKPLFTAPIPSLSDSSTTPQQRQDKTVAPSRPHGIYAGPVQLASASARPAEAPRALSLPPIVPSRAGSTSAAPRPQASRSATTWLGPLHGGPAAAQPSYSTVRAHPTGRYAHSTIRHGDGNGYSQREDGAQEKIELVELIDIQPATTSVWERLSLAAHTETTPRMEPDTSSTFSGALTGAWSGAITHLTDVSATPRDALTLEQSTPTRRIIQNNGQVVAMGVRISYRDSDLITNTIENTSVNGWFAIGGGEISLPPIRLTEGVQWRNWGEDAADESIDLINSLRLELTSSHDDFLRISLLAVDHTEVPSLPQGHQFVGVWKLVGGTSIVSDIELTVRYDDTLLAARKLDENNIKLWYFSSSEWQRATDGFYRDVALNHVGGLIPISRFFAVSTPEPTAAGIVILLGSAGLLRRVRSNRNS